MSREKRIGFLGAGRMAVALARGFLRAGLVAAHEIIAADPEASARTGFASATGAETVVENPTVCSAETVIVAVKPHCVAGVLHEVAGSVSSRQLFVSIAAGVTLAKLEAELPMGTRVVRVMPNTPAVVGASATAFATGSHCTPADVEWVQRLFASVGVAVPLAEHLLDAVTGLSGSGPAYAFLVIEALSDGGVAAGLPREVSTRLAAQTMLGAARMVLETGSHPGVLKDQVASPGGTTIEGLHELEKGGVRGALMTAVRGAAEKSRWLGQH